MKKVIFRKIPFVGNSDELLPMERNITRNPITLKLSSASDDFDKLTDGTLPELPFVKG